MEVDEGEVDTSCKKVQRHNKWEEDRGLSMLAREAQFHRVFISLIPALVSLLNALLDHGRDGCHD